MTDLAPRLLAQLVADWVGERSPRPFSLLANLGGSPTLFLLGDGRRRLVLAVLQTWENSPAVEAPRQDVAQRLAALVRGPFLLWLPPFADVPTEEPAQSDFVARVQLAASPLAPGARGEVRLPVRVRVAKRDDQRGYASVLGALNRWWAVITERVSGTILVDATAMRRAPRDEAEREVLFDQIAQLSLSLEPGQSAEFEMEERWTIQRLRDGDGFAVVGAPPGVDPNEGAAMRRILRRELKAAGEALAATDAELRGVAMAGSCEFAEHEGIGSLVRSIDPSLYSGFDLVTVLVDGEARPIVVRRSLLEEA